MLSRKTKSPTQPDSSDESSSRALGDLVAALEDPHTHQFLRSYLGITDEQLKAHIRRLVDETGVQRKTGSKEQ